MQHPASPISTFARTSTSTFGGRITRSWPMSVVASNVDVLAGEVDLGEVERDVAGVAAVRAVRGDLGSTVVGMNTSGRPSPSVVRAGRRGGGQHPDAQREAERDQQPGPADPRADHQAETRPRRAPPRSTPSRRSRRRRAFTIASVPRAIAAAESVARPSRERGRLTLGFGATGGTEYGMPG